MAKHGSLSDIFFLLHTFRENIFRCVRGVSQVIHKTLLYYIDRDGEEFLIGCKIALVILPAANRLSLFLMLYHEKEYRRDQEYSGMVSRKRKVH